MSHPPVFLLGCPRSGTSLLYKMVCLHPGAAWISNYVRRLPARPELAVLNRLAGHLPERRTHAWFGVDGANAYVYGGQRSVVDRFFPMPVEGEPVFRRCGVPELPTDPVGADAPERLRRSVAAICRASGGTTFVSKRIANNQRIPLLHEAFPEARFVCLTRDGRSVASSLSRVNWWKDSIVFWYGGPPTRWAEEGGDPWELCAREWLEQTRSIDEGLAGVPAGQVLRLRYEDLLADPLGIIRQVTAFTGLAGDAQHERRLREISFPDQAMAWRSELPADALATIEAVQADELRARGYEVRR